MKFEELVLSDSLELLIDNRGKNPPYAPTGIPVVSGMSVRPSGLDLSESKFATIATWKKWMPAATKCGDVILTSEAPLGRVALVPSDDPLLIGQRVFALRGRVGVLDSRFLYYAFRTARVQADLASRATGSTVLGVRQPELRKVLIPAPGYDKQLAIAAVLAALDDRIAANEQVIAAAESLMLAVVAAIHECVPVSVLANQSSASAKPASFNSTVAHFSLPAFDDGCQPHIVDSTTVKSNKFLLSKPSVLFSKLNPRIPRIWNVSQIPTQMAVASTEFVVLVPAGVDSSALWAALAQPNISETLRQKVAGTSGSHQRIRPSELLEVRVPDVRTLDKSAAALVEDLGRVCHQRRQESSDLISTRDKLLPLLMSGRIRVKDAEARVSGWCDASTNTRTGRR